MVLNLPQSYLFVEPDLQQLNIDGKVPSFIRSTFVNGSSYSVVSVEQRTSRHALRQLLGHLDQLNAVFNG